MLTPPCTCPLGSHPSSSDTPPSPPGLSGPDSSVVSESAVSWAAGARAVLRCQSPRMVWTQDRLHDRQRVVHWDLSGGPAGGPAHRLVDMYSAGEQRVYKLRDRGRLQLPPSAFHDGNFSLLIRGRGRGTAAGARGLRGLGGLGREPGPRAHGGALPVRSGGGDRRGAVHLQPASPLLSPLREPGRATPGHRQR